jgi:hypothetical protein
VHCIAPEEMRLFPPPGNITETRLFEFVCRVKFVIRGEVVNRTEELTKISLKNTLGCSRSSKHGTHREGSPL